MAAGAGAPPARVAAFALVLHYDADVLIDLQAAGDADERAAAVDVARFLLPASFAADFVRDPRAQRSADELFAAAVAGQRAREPQWRSALTGDDQDAGLRTMLLGAEEFADPIAFAEMLSGRDRRVRARAIFAACRLWRLPLPVGVADAVLPLRDGLLRTWLADLAPSHRGFCAGDVPALLERFAGDLDVPWNLVAATDRLDGEPLERLADGLFADLPPLRLGVRDVEAEQGSAAPFLVRTRDVGMLRTLFVASLGDAGHRLVVRRAAQAAPDRTAVYLAGLCTAPLPSVEGLREAAELCARQVASQDATTAALAAMLARRCGTDPRLPAAPHAALQGALARQRLPVLPDRPEQVFLLPLEFEAACAAGGERTRTAWSQLAEVWRQRPEHVLDLVRLGQLRPDRAASAVDAANPTLPELKTLVPSWSQALRFHAAKLAKACERAPSGDPTADLAALRALVDGAPWQVRLAAVRRAAALGAAGRTLCDEQVAAALAEPDKAAWRATAELLLALGLPLPRPGALAAALREPPQERHDLVLADAVLLRFAGRPLADTRPELQFEVALQSGLERDVSGWRTLLADSGEDRLLRLCLRLGQGAYPVAIRLAAIDVCAERGAHVWPWHIASLLADDEPVVRLAAYRAVRRIAPPDSAWGGLVHAAVFDPAPEVRAFGESLPR